MEFKDYYQSLGVARDAPAEAIKKAYRKLARKYHPDVSKEPDAEQRMKEINEAYAVLSDPEKRAAYDQLGQHAPGQDFRPPPDWDANMEFSEREFSGAESAQFSDFFAEIFGRRAAPRFCISFEIQRPPRAHPARPRGQLHRAPSASSRCACRRSTPRAARASKRARST